MAKKNELELLTEEKIKNGGILAKIYFDIQDKDKERLQPLLTDLINNRLLKERGVVYGAGMINDPIKSDDIFVTSAAVTMLFESLSSIINVAFNYAPAGIEIIKPEREFNISTFDVQRILLDLSNVSITYSKYIMEHVLKPEELELVKKQLKNRAELGKNAIGNKKNENNEKN